MAGRPTAPQVAVELDRTRHLRFDFNAAANFEAVTGKNMFQGGTLGSLSATDMRAFLWACLVWEDAELTLDNVGALIHFGNLAEVTGKLTEVYQSNTPTGDGGEGRP